tara:strand:- start:61464 stop:62318 length:855 start_codon:yes stop_codon:yes gene_type:complete
MGNQIVQKEYPYKHWQYLDFETGNKLRVVPERGGLISGWECNGKEILYFDLERFNLKNKSIRGGIPILFPICGDLPSQLLRLPQGEFSLQQHGFARDIPWQIKPLHKQEGISLSITNTAYTKELYPFNFLIEMEASLQQNSLLIKTTIYNQGEEKMPFSFGLHPYFKVSDLQNISISGLPDICTNHVDMTTASTEIQLANLAKGIDFISSPKGPVSLFDFESGASIEMQSEEPMDLAVVWTDPPRRMVCLEPWTSPRRSLINGEKRLFINPGSFKELRCRFVSN